MIAGRVMPLCPHFGACGGCQQQHASTELQQKVKAARSARLVGHDVTNKHRADRPGASSPRSPEPQLPVKTERLEMGFNKAGSSDIVSVTRCSLFWYPILSVLPGRAPLSTSLDGDAFASVYRTGELAFCNF